MASDPWEVEWREVAGNLSQTWWEDFRWIDLGDGWYAWEGVIPSHSFGPRAECTN